MKRPIIIIIGVVLVFVLIAVWVYVLFFKEAGENNAFADLNFENSTEEIIETSGGGDSAPIVNVNDFSRLRQLTTTPVAGFQEVTRDASSTPEVYYISAGTGHIFSINLETGEEKRVSGTTIPSTENGVITQDGQYVIIQSGFSSNKEVVVGMFSYEDDKLIDQVSLDDVYDFETTASSTFLIATKAGNNITGTHYLPLSGESDSLFSVPFSEVSIDWGNQASDNHYIYPKTHNLLGGYLYQAKNNSLKRLPVAGLGLSALGNNEYVLNSSQDNQRYSTGIYNVKEDFLSSFRTNIMPEKCVSMVNKSSFICGVSASVQYDHQTPTDWYQGVVSYDDDLWEINPKNGSSTNLLDTDKESGRFLDVTDPRINYDDTRLYFKNKNDNTLWLYLLTEPNN